jgi:hypothetical protein
MITLWTTSAQTIISFYLGIAIKPAEYLNLQELANHNLTEALEYKYIYLH